MYFNKIYLLNVWDVFFALNSDKNPKICKQNWCDIERLILSSLIDTDKIKNPIKKGCVLLSSTINWPRIKKYILDKQTPTNHLDCFVVNFILEKMELLGVPIWKYFSFLLNELKEFEKNFGQFIFEQLHDTYLENLNYGREFLNISYIEKAYDTINMLCDFNKLVEIDTFNYSYIHKDNLMNILQHINGHYLKPIFGIDTIFDPAEETFIFTKTSRRIESDLADDWFENKASFNNVVIFGHSLDEFDYSYFFPVFDQLKLTDSLATSKIVFAYSIYDQNLEDLILSELRQSISKILLEYAISKNLPNPKRFLDSLSTEHRIITYKLPNLINGAYQRSFNDISWAQIYKEVDMIQGSE